MDMEGGWHFKSSKHKGPSSLDTLDRFGHVVSPTSHVNSFKNDITCSPKRETYSLGDLKVSNKFTALGNPPFYNEDLSFVLECHKDYGPR